MKTELENWQLWSKNGTHGIKIFVFFFLGGTADEIECHYVTV